MGFGPADAGNCTHPQAAAQRSADRVHREKAKFFLWIRGARRSHKHDVVMRSHTSGEGGTLRRGLPVARFVASKNLPLVLETREKPGPTHTALSPRPAPPPSTDCAPRAPNVHQLCTTPPLSPPPSSLTPACTKADFHAPSRILRSPSSSGKPLTSSPRSPCPTGQRDPGSHPRAAGNAQNTSASPAAGRPARRRS